MDATNLTALLPKYINDSLLCFTLVPHGGDGAVDLVTCNTNGYMYEIRKKAIVRCMNLNENATSVSCYCLTENRKLVMFYIVFTSSNRLLVIRRTNKHLKVCWTIKHWLEEVSFKFSDKLYGQYSLVCLLCGIPALKLVFLTQSQVVNIHDRVEEFQVFDFECLGYPQIKITFIDGFGDDIYKFPVTTNIEPECSENESTMAESLAEELQILNKHIDELSEEYNHLSKLCGFSDSSSAFKLASVGSISFSSGLSKAPAPELVVCEKWQRVYGNSLVLGMKLHNTGSQILNDVEVIIKSKDVKEYSYGFFQPSTDVHSLLFAPRMVCPSVKPDGKVCAVGAVRVPAFFTDSGFSVSFYVTTSDLKGCLVKEIFEVGTLDIASSSTAGLEDHFTVEDLMAISTVKSETTLKIQTDDLGDDTLESMLIRKLGFKRIRHLKDKMFYCTSTYLNEVFAGLRHVSVNPSVWTMIVYSSDSSQIFFLVNALYDLLPDNTSILCDE